MSGSQHARPHASPLHLKRSATAKATRSAPGHSHHRTPTKPHKHRKHQKNEDEAEEEIFSFEDEDMATSFLQYCAMCEKQILVPNSSYLYCSEHCRQVDATPSPERSSIYDAFTASYTAKERYPSILDPLGLSLPRYVPALQPTPRPQTDARIPPRQHNAKVDLDPTEWKPAEASVSDDERGKCQKAIHTNQSAIPKRESDALHPRSKYQHASEVEVKPSGGVRAMPSLSHASTATASSSSSSASSLSETPYSMISAPTTSVPTTSMRYDSSAFGIEGLRLGGNGDLKYEKRAVGRDKRRSAASGSLKKLLGGEHVDGM